MTSWPNYINEAKVWLPMTQGAHDAGNNRTLDLSGNGLHYRFGDGSTAGTFPTKLSGQRGYQFDGSNDRLEALVNQTNAITEGTWAVLFDVFDGSTRRLWSHRDGSGNVRSELLTSGGAISFYVGDMVNPTSISAIVNRGVLFAAGRRTSDGFRRLFVNGINSTPNNSGTNTIGISTINPYIGLTYAGLGPFLGRIFWYGHWEYALSEIQLRDLESRLRKEFNNV